jgi:hypothetical protein
VIWQPASAGGQELRFAYSAKHAFDNESEHGQAEFSYGLRIRIARADTPATYREGKIVFPIELPPGRFWHACIHLIPLIEGTSFEPLYSCRSFCGVSNTYETRRHKFLNTATRFVTPDTNTLTSVVAG